MSSKRRSTQTELLKAVQRIADNLDYLTWLAMERAALEGRWPTYTTPAEKAAQAKKQEELRERREKRAKEAVKNAPKPRDPNAPDLNIYSGRLPKVHPTKAILDFMDGKGWHPATLTQAERDAAAKAAEEQRTGLVEIPEPVWE